MQAAALSEENLPGKQGEHATVLFKAAYLPPLQDLRVIWAIWFWYCPALHDRQPVLFALLRVPTGQLEHDTMPEPEARFPAVQGSQEDCAI